MHDSTKLMPRVFKSKHLSTSRRSIAAIFAIAVVAVSQVNGTGEPVAQPLAWKSLEPGYFEHSGFSTIGRIYEINRTTYNIAVISDKPFWAPMPRVTGRIALWPTNALLVVHLAPIAPIIIHGQKVRFENLVIGQVIRVQYSIFNSAHGGYGCGARRIDG